ncbi:hypothetical protein CYMTET_51428 [Cymbomonas tetramitiformis]|uniref:GPI inositol-deacylase n=1 Tax=Cymbomonas tetramitiformis TaxID=36881 RepID=A0AAE0ESD0_9CHLO|nr:hypothetical protein CYMTET_51428 [Cymbomonas tetramitiformis]
MASSPIISIPSHPNKPAWCTSEFTVPKSTQMFFGRCDRVVSEWHSAFYASKLERKDWFKIAQALLTPAFWTSNCTTNPAYTWYIGRIEETVERAKMESQCEKVHLVGHSAGGWLARAYLGGVACPATQGDRGAAKLVGPRHCDVRSLVSLGSPHLSPPASAPDMTRGTLRWVNEKWPGAHFMEEGVKYVCVTGRTVKGDANAEKGTLSRYASVSYSQVCGEGDTVEGDAVVPNSSAILQANCAPLSK